jgi:hypothetical protein
MHVVSLYIEQNKNPKQTRVPGENQNYDYWKKSQITDISTFCYWLHQKGVGIYE